MSEKREMLMYWVRIDLKRNWSLWSERMQWRYGRGDLDAEDFRQRMRDYKFGRRFMAGRHMRSVCAPDSKSGTDTP